MSDRSAHEWDKSDVSAAIQKSNIHSNSEEQYALEFGKRINTQSRLRNKFLKFPIKANESLFKKQWNNMRLIKACVRYLL